MIGCFYRRLPAEGDFQVFGPTDCTRSNWSPELQHGSPPLALLTKLIEEQAPGSGLRIGRLSLDILGPIPVAPVRARAWVERRGSRVSMIVAELLADRAGGAARTVARMTAWLIAVTDTADVVSDRYPPLVEGPAEPLPPLFVGVGGYFDAVNLRAQNTEGESAAVAWLSPKAYIVDAEPASALQRLAAVVDTANGVGAALGPRPVRVHEHRHRRSSPSASGRRGFRAAGARIDRTRRHRGDDC